MGSVRAQPAVSYFISNSNFESVDQNANVIITATGLNPLKAYRLYLKQGDFLSVLNPSVTLYDDGPFTSLYAKLPSGHNGTFTMSFSSKPQKYTIGLPPNTEFGNYAIGWTSYSAGVVAFGPSISEESTPNIVIASNSIAGLGWFGGKPLIVVPGVPNAPTNLNAQFYSSAITVDNYFELPQSFVPNTYGGLYIEKPIVVDRDVIIDGIFGSFSGYVYIKSPATITVTNGYKLYLGKTAFSSASTSTWGGIMVNTGGTLSTNYPTGIIDRTFIEQATTAIQALPGSNVLVGNTDFRGNYIGIDFNGSPGEAFELQVTGSNFYKGILMKPSPIQGIDLPVEYFETLQPYAGIRICNTNKNIGDYCAGNPSCLNQFYNMENGIILKNSSGDFSSCKFRDIRHLYNADNTFKGNAIYARSSNLFDAHSLYYKGQNNEQNLDIKDCDNGIMTYNYSLTLRDAHLDNISNIGVEASDGLLKQSKIENNVIEAGTSSIRMFGNLWSGIDVVDNYLNVFSGAQGASACVDMASNDNLSFGLAGSSGGITIRNNFLNNYAQGQGVRSVMDVFPVIKNNYFTTNDMKYGDGIRLDGGSLAYALCNNFSQPVMGTAGQEASAIRTFLNPNSYISCNSEVKYPQGLTFLGTSTGSTIKGNSFNQNRRGLFYEFDGITGKQPDLFLAGVKLHGNDWNGYAYPNMQGARHNGTSDNIVEASQYTVNPNSYPTHTTSISIANSTLTWFSNNSGYQTYFCSEEVAPLKCGNNGPLTPMIVPSNPDSADVFVVVDSIDSEHYPNSYKWIAKRQVYDKLLRWPGMINSKTVFLPFYNGNISSSIGQFSNMKRNINRAALIPGFNETGYRLQLRSIDSLENLLRLAVGQVTPNQQVILQLENAIVLARNTLSQSNANNILLRNARLTNLDAINGAINAQAIYEQNEKLVNDVKISYLIQGMAALDSLTMVSMIEIAEQCPLIAGESVFGARYLVSRKMNLNWDDYDLCETNQSRSKKTENINLEYGAVLSPNPFTNQLQVNFEGNEMKELRIFDMKGLVVHASQVISGQQVDVSDLLSGFYVAELTATGTASIKLKLIKL